MRNAFIQQLSLLAAKRPEIMLLTGDLGFGVLEEFARRFPRQYANAGVAEQNMTGLAAGLALEGRIVFTYSLGNFPTLRCLEQIRNDACYHNLNVKIVTVGGGMSYGPVGASHHATEDIAIMRALPNTAVISPGDVWEASEATRAVVDWPGVAYLRLDKSAAPSSHAAEERFQIGRARRVREGSDVTMISTGGILGEVLEAAETLSRLGVSARVLSVHTVKPLDAAALIAAAKETGGIVTIEEHTISGGLGSAVAETLLEEGPAPHFFVRVGLASCFSSVVGSQTYLRQIYGLDAAAIVETVLARTGKRHQLRGVA